MSEAITIIQSDVDGDNDNTEQLVHLAQASMRSTTATSSYDKCEMARQPACDCSYQFHCSRAIRNAGAQPKSMWVI